MTNTYYLSKWSKSYGWIRIKNNKTMQEFTYNNIESAKQAARKLSYYGRVMVSTKALYKDLPVALYVDGRLKKYA